MATGGNFLDDFRAAITTMQTTVGQVVERMNRIEQANATNHQNVVAIDRRLSGHEAIHDPYLIKIDALEVKYEALKDELNQRVPEVERRTEHLGMIVPEGFGIVGTQLTAAENGLGAMSHEMTAVKAAIQDIVNKIGGSTADLTGQADLMMATANKATMLESRLGVLEIEHQNVFTELKTVAAQLQSSGVPPPPGLGGPNDRAHALANLKSSRPAEGEFDGRRENYDEFRKSTISWASAQFPDVESYLSWAEDQTRAISAEDVESSSLGPLGVSFHRQFRRELWSFLKPKSEARDIINDCGVGDGLEAWRLLKCLCRPQSGARAVIDVKGLVNPAPAQEVALVPSALAKWESALREYVAKRQGADPMADLGMKKVVAVQIFPPEMAYDFTKELHKFATWAEFKAEVLDYVDRMSRIGSRTLKTKVGPVRGPNDMDLSAVNDGWSNGNDPWALAAVGKGGHNGAPPWQQKGGTKGKGKGDGKCFTCGGNHFARDCPNGPPKGKGKGKGKNSSGRQGWGLCRAFQRTGQCPRGDDCPYAHAKVPKNLQGLNNLCLEDLGEVVEKDGVYQSINEAALDPLAVLAAINDEMAEIEKELAQTSGDAGGAQGFTGQPPKV